MYSDTSACVSTELGPTEWFKTASGVLQGDTLSPYLFIVLLDYALKKTLQDDVGFLVCKRNGRRHPAIHIGALAYADDIYVFWPNQLTTSNVRFIGLSPLLPKSV